MDSLAWGKESQETQEDPYFCLLNTVFTPGYFGVHKTQVGTPTHPHGLLICHTVMAHCPQLRLKHT